jgi:hypothetical protein
MPVHPSLAGYSDERSEYLWIYCDCLSSLRGYIPYEVDYYLRKA